MKKNKFDEFLGSIDLRHIIFNTYSLILIGFLIFPVVFWILIILEWLFFS